MAPLHGDIKPNLIGSKFVSKSPVSLNNIDKFLDLLRTKSDKNFGVPMPLDRINVRLLRGYDRDLILFSDN
jgi:hypothetical protein